MRDFLNRTEQRGDRNTTPLKLCLSEIAEGKGGSNLKTLLHGECTFQEKFMNARVKNEPIKLPTVIWKCQHTRVNKHFKKGPMEFSFEHTKFIFTLSHQNTFVSVSSIAAVPPQELSLERNYWRKSVHFHLGDQDLN